MIKRLRTLSDTGRRRRQKQGMGAARERLIELCEKFQLISENIVKSRWNPHFFQIQRRVDDEALLVMCASFVRPTGPPPSHWLAGLYSALVARLTVGMDGWIGERFRRVPKSTVLGFRDGNSGKSNISHWAGLVLCRARAISEDRPTLSIGRCSAPTECAIGGGLRRHQTRRRWPIVRPMRQRTIKCRHPCYITRRVSPASTLYQRTHHISGQSAPFFAARFLGTFWPALTPHVARHTALFAALIAA